MTSPATFVSHPMRFAIRFLFAAIPCALTVLTGNAAPPAPATPLGSPAFQPSPERPIGWRGDGSGKFLGATGPLSWERKAEGDGYTTKGIVWMAPLPNIGVSCPIVVGNKIFITCEPNDLVCLDKLTGKILWIRSNPEFESLSEEDRKADPAYAEKLAPLSADLAKTNAEVVAILNERLPKALTSAWPKKTDVPVQHKRDLEKQILDGQNAIDKKRFTHNWAQVIFGYAGTTPTSDGKHVCAFYTTGVTVCYDLDGNRKWIASGSGNGSEHGNFASPLLCSNQLVVWANEMRSYDVNSGKVLWTTPAKAFNTYGSLFRFQSGGEWVAAYQWGFFTRVRDGKAIWDKGVFGDAVPTPIVEGDTIFTQTGYPKYNDNNKGFRAYKIPASTESGKIEPAYVLKIEWADDEIPADKKKSPFDRGYVASPLYVDGLVYQVTQGGGLVVNDAATGDLVYRKVLALKPRTEYWMWAGCSASPTLAGKNIYLMDNQGTTLVIQPGKEYKELARNYLAELKEGKDQVQNVSTPIFEGARMYYRTPEYLYCIGAK